MREKSINAKENSILTSKGNTFLGKLISNKIKRRVVVHKIKLVNKIK